MTKILQYIPRKHTSHKKNVFFFCFFCLLNTLYSSFENQDHFYYSAPGSWDKRISRKTHRRCFRISFD